MQYSFGWTVCSFLDIDLTRYILIVGCKDSRYTLQLELQYILPCRVDIEAPLAQS